MADWTNIPDATFDPDRPVLGSTHLAIVKNFEALAEGASGAPRVANAALNAIQTGIIADSAVTTAKIANANVTRVKLTTGTSSVSGTVGSVSNVTVNLSPYSFFPSLSGAPQDLSINTSGSSASADSPRFAIRNFSGDAQSYAVAWRFINA